MISLLSRPVTPNRRPAPQATRDLTPHEREARRLALRNAAAVADMVAWLGADYCLAKRNTAHATD